MSLGPSVPAENKRRKTNSSTAESKQNQTRGKVQQLLTKFLDLGKKTPIPSDEIYDAFDIKFKKEENIQSRYVQQDAEEAYGQMLQNLGLYDTLCRTKSTYVLGKNNQKSQNLSYPTSRDFVLKSDGKYDQYYEFQTLTSLKINENLTKNTLNEIQDDCKAMLLSPERRGVYINKSPIKVIKNQLPSKYKLKAIILKSGEEDHGHFVCIVNRGDKWYFIDDHKIEEVDSFSRDEYDTYETYVTKMYVTKISSQFHNNPLNPFFIRSLLFFNTELAPFAVLKNNNETVLRLKKNSLQNMTHAQRNVIGNYNKVFWSVSIAKQLTEKRFDDQIQKRLKKIISIGDFINICNENYIFLKHNENETPLPRVFENKYTCSEEDNMKPCANQCYLIAMFNSMMIPYNGWPYITNINRSS